MQSLILIWFCLCMESQTLLSHHQCDVQVPDFLGIDQLTAMPFENLDLTHLEYQCDNNICST